jgi:hypothetical protein
VIVAAVAWVLWTRTRPSYDAFGWLVWGRQVLHWDLNTDGAPSWKPLTFLFTLPYALAGANPQMWLWMITSSAGALAGGVFAGRIAYRLTGPCPRRPWAPWAAAAFAAVGVLGIDGYSELVLIANSDPIVVTLLLAAIDSHLSGRRRLALGLLVAVSLGRPEGWVFAGLYGAWAWRAQPSMRALVAAGAVLIPVAWFVVPALTSHSWFISGDLALGSPNVIHGNKILGVLDRLRGLYELPMQLAVAFALVLAAVRRDRVWLGLAASAALWTVIEIALAYHGWSAVARYLLEPAAVLVVLAGGAVGRVLAYESRRGGLLRWAPTALVLVLVVAVVPVARSRARRAQRDRRRPPRRRPFDPATGGDRPRRRREPYQGLRPAGERPRLPERAGLGARPQCGQRGLRARPVDRPANPGRPLRTPRRWLAGASHPHPRRRRGPL